MKQINLLIKPVTGRCNLRCKYCFYYDVTGRRENVAPALMNGETIEQIVEMAVHACDTGGDIWFSFQGGEPLLAGVEFYRAFINCVNQLIKPGIRVHYVIQTNGLRVDQDYVELFRQNDFLVGLSIDGFREMHDLHRMSANGGGSWKPVQKALRLLLEGQVDTNALCVVTKACARNPKKAYRSLKQMGLRYLQFIPCLDPDASTRGNMPYSLLPDEYGSFLCALFDEWYHDWQSGKYVSIRLFDDYVHLLMGMPAGMCSLNGSCGGYLAIESDGSIYPCDFFMMDRHRIGAVKEGLSLDDLLTHGLHQMQSVLCAAIPVECASCTWKNICHGGCIRDRFSDQGNIRNYYCKSFQKFFTYAIERLRYIADCETEALARQNSNVYRHKILQAAAIGHNKD